MVNTLGLKKKKILYDLDKIDRSLIEFDYLYKSRPITDNSGGMTSTHLFNTWYVLRKLKPKLVIESGVWKGLGTWVIEKALPGVKIISIDVDYTNLEFKSLKATYYDRDMKTYNWEAILREKYPDIEKEEIVVFLDDHHDILDRIEFINNLGIKHIIYEDNYPSLQGDVLSPKKILACQDYIIDQGGKRRMNKFSYLDYEKFLNFVRTYQELPPIFKLDKTRWGDKWDEINYSTELPLLSIDKRNKFDVFYEEAPDYTWICYLELK